MKTVVQMNYKYRQTQRGRRCAGGLGATELKSTTEAGASKGGVYTTNKSKAPTSAAVVIYVPPTTPLLPRPLLAHPLLCGPVGKGPHRVWGVSPKSGVNQKAGPTEKRRGWWGCRRAPKQRPTSIGGPPKKWPGSRDRGSGLRRQGRRLRGQAMGGAGQAFSVTAAGSAHLGPL